MKIVGDITRIDPFNVPHALVALKVGEAVDYGTPGTGVGSEVWKFTCGTGLVDLVQRRRDDNEKIIDYLAIRRARPHEPLTIPRHTRSLSGE